MSDAFWQAAPLMITAIGGVVVLIIKELKTSKAIDKNRNAIEENTALTKDISNKTDDIHEKQAIESGLDNSHRIAAQRLEISEAKRLAAEEALKESDKQTFNVEIKEVDIYPDKGKEK